MDSNYYVQYSMDSQEPGERASIPKFGVSVVSSGYYPGNLPHHPEKHRPSHPSQYLLFAGRQCAARTRKKHKIPTRGGRSEGVPTVEINHEVWTSCCMVHGNVYGWYPYELHCSIRPALTTCLSGHQHHRLPIC